MSTQRPRRIGLGVQQPSEVSVQLETFKTAESAQSSDVAVRERGPKEAPEEGVVVNSVGGGLETKALQNLDSEAKTEVEAVSAADPLTEMLKQSEPHIAGERITLEAATEMGLPAVDGADGYTLIRGKQYAIGIDHATGDEKSVMAVIKMGEAGLPDELVQAMNLERLGQLPNGETRTTILIKEGYWEGVVSAAEAEDVSIEQWLTNELAERLEDRFFGRH